MSDRADEKPLFIAPRDLAVSTGNGEVWLRLGGFHQSLGFSEGLVLAAALSPHEAIAIGQLLVEKAHEVLGGSSQH